MKLTLSQSDLNRAIKQVYPAVKQSVVIPICETIKFDVAKDGLTLTATNMQVELSCKIAGKFEKGAFCLPANKLNTLISMLPEQPLEIDVNDKIAVIRTANGKYELPISDAVDFPVFKTETDKSLVIDSEVFRDGISKTIFACSDDNMKPQQTGVFIEISDGRISFTATDAHRINHMEYTVKSTLKASLIIPASSLKLMPQIEGDMDISFGNNSLSIQSDKLSFKSTLIDAEFPDYKAVIPVNDKILIIDRGMFHKAIKRVSGFSNFATNLLKLHLNGSVIISGKNPDYSEYAEEELKGEYVNDALTIGLSAELLSESLNSLDCENVYILLSEPNKGVLIKEQLDSVSYILVMPMFLEN